MEVQQTKSKAFWTIVNSMCVGFAIVLIPVFYSKGDFFFMSMEVLALTISASWLMWGRGNSLQS